MKILKVITALTVATFTTLFTAASENTNARPQVLNSYLNHGYTEAVHRPTAAVHLRLFPGGMHANLPPIHYITADNPSAVSSRPGAASTKVAITGIQFLPAVIHVKAGETVTWINHEPILHALTSQNNGLLASHPLSHGSIFSHVFKQPGIFHYYCMLHPSKTGVVVVD